MDYYNYNGGKLFGKVYSFDGEVGTIVSNNQGTYEFLLKDLNSENIKIGDLVEFYPNTVRFGNEKSNLARRVTVIQLNNGIKINKGRF